MSTYKLGADPEIFVGDSVSVRSIIGKIGGTKDEPRPLPLGHGFAVQEDNVALEFNIPASDTRAEFITNITKATAYLEELIKETHGLQFVKASAVSFPIEEMYSPEAFKFGCDPDFNAWTNKRNPRPKAEDKLLRSCGGHVHIGFAHAEYNYLEVIKACDLYLGVPSVLLDSGVLRKELYGKAGAFRKKSYGAEYRTLSNFWVFDDKLVGWVHDSVGQALDAVSRKVDFDAERDCIVAAINNNDHALAEHLISKYNLYLPEVA